jgi:hypothetical protein
MQSYILGPSLLGALVINALATTSSLAITCSDRRQVCFAYCEKNHHNAPRCRGVCEQLLTECMSTGCWNSKITARRCDIFKQQTVHRYAFSVKSAGRLGEIIPGDEEQPCCRDWLPPFMQYNKPRNFGGPQCGSSRSRRTRVSLHGWTQSNERVATIGTSR